MVAPQKEGIDIIKNTKPTKKGMFVEILKVVEGNEDMVNFINHEIELLDRKKSSNSESKTQIENKAIKEKIVNALTQVAREVTITELQSVNEDMASYSNQKLSALLKQLVEDGLVERVEDKKKAFFKAI